MRTINVYKGLALAAVLLVALSQCTPDDDPVKTPGDLLAYPYNPEPYNIVKPDHFPAIEVPADNPMTQAGVQLGRRLFYDPILSGDSTMSCASCHFPEISFTDAKAVSTGIDGIAGRRSAMSLLNIAYVKAGLFWDGRAKTLEDQALLPVEDPIELHTSWVNVVDKLKKHPEYPKLFRAAFGIEDRSEMTKELAAKAMAQFERILISSGNSKYDRFKFKGETWLFDDDEIDGFAMFFEESVNLNLNLPDAQCFHCHGGITMTGNVYFSNGLDAVNSFQDYTDKGRGLIVNDSTKNGLFRSPTLRNIALTAPYMHDGRFQTLEQVLDHYGNHGKSRVPYQDVLIEQVGFPIAGSNPLKYTTLTTSHKNKIIKFLHTLTDTSFVNNPDIQNPFK
ncbi:MAG: cytochrome-c peroxidase [Chitinophagales bacterium]|nr:cytochrome-c peroxidase [Chitinophagales bacterium]